MSDMNIRQARVNNLIIAVQVLVFAACLLTGSPGEGPVYVRGILYAPLLLKGKDFYRLVTAVFLHADAGHLFNNMIVQFAGGSILEPRVGHARYAGIYLLSGIIGNVVSVAVDFLTGSYGFSLGASGAVFGVLGALIFLIFRAGIRQSVSGRYRSLLVRTGLMTVWLLYSGWSNPSINQAAHVGGLVCGFLLCAVLMHGRGSDDLEELLH